MKKAILFTLDAMFALVFSLVIISASVYFVLQPNLEVTNSEKVRLISYSALAVMEKQAMLERAIVNSDNSQIQSFIDSFPLNVCAEVTFRDSRAIITSQVFKQSCTIGEEYFITRRIFIANNDIYYADLRVS